MLVLFVSCVNKGNHTIRGYNMVGFELLKRRFEDNWTGEAMPLVLFMLMHQIFGPSMILKERKSGYSKNGAPFLPWGSCGFAFRILPPEYSDFCHRHFDNTDLRLFGILLRGRRHESLRPRSRRHDLD